MRVLGRELEAAVQDLHTLIELADAQVARCPRFLGRSELSDLSQEDPHVIIISFPVAVP